MRCFLSSDFRKQQIAEMLSDRICDSVRCLIRKQSVQLRLNTEVEFCSIEIMIENELFCTVQERSTTSSDVKFHDFLALIYFMKYF